MKYLRLILSACLLQALFLHPFNVLAQTCKKGMAETTPATKFTLRADGTATHLPSGLMWMRCSLGQNWTGKTCSGEASLFSWGSALQAADRHSFAGHSDWRLPSKNELASILEESCVSPAINEKVFPAAPATYFWSASPYAGVANGAWSVDFGFGSINASVKSGNLNIRLVRGGM